MIAQNALTLEAELLEHADRGRIFRIDIRFDSVQFKASKAKLEHSGDSLRDRTLAPTRTQQVVPDHGSGGLPVETVKAASANHFTICAPRDRPTDAFTLLVPRLKMCDQFFGLFKIRERLEVVILRHLIVAENLENRATVGAGKLPQDQVIRFQDWKRLEPESIHLCATRQTLIWA